LKASMKSSISGSLIACAGLADFHHHRGPLEWRHGANYGVQTVIG